MQKRNPLIDKSIYSICWLSRPQEPVNDDTDMKVNGSFLLVSFENEGFSTTAVSALRKLGVSSDDIWSIIIQGVDCEIQEKLQPLFTKVYNQSKEITVLNLLPMSTSTLQCEVANVPKASWLCFESTLEMMKILSKLNMSNSKVIAVFCTNDFENSRTSSKLSSWGAISRGLVVSAGLEARERVISAELRCTADENAFIKLILASMEEIAENRIAITDKQVLQPFITRFEPKVVDLYI